MNKRILYLFGVFLIIAILLTLCLVLKKDKHGGDTNKCSNVSCSDNQVCDITTGKCIPLGVSACFDKNKTIGQSFQYMLDNKNLVKEYVNNPKPNDPSGTGSGLLQIVNGGKYDMWIRYGGNGLDSWKDYITNSSALNNQTAHPFNSSPGGQGNAFLLKKGEFQILPLVGKAAWLGATSGCCKDGTNCIQSPMGRGGGAGSADQPNTLFEWTVGKYGVWDTSAVDGYALPARTLVAGGEPGNVDPNTIKGDYMMKFSKATCNNRIISDGKNPDKYGKKGQYLGCSSACGCQYAALSIDPSGNSKAPHCADMLTPNDAYKVSPKFNNEPGGYCGTSDNKSVDLMHKMCGVADPLSDNTKLCANFCTGIKQAAQFMDGPNKGKRLMYCFDYDDDAGTMGFDSGVIKLIFCDDDFEIPPKDC